jgi:glycosyltransferase involved in cell wall biosynthesis
MVESVVDGETGFFIPKKDSPALADCLIQLLSDDDLARRIGENGRKRAVEAFSRERMARDTAALYEKAVKIHQPELVGA